MSELPEDRSTGLGPGEEPAAACDEDAHADLDSEPRRKWQPNPALLRALEATQKDLRPGEASLYWDWTATRDSAPEAEYVRPSGVGEVLVSDKEAAAAYVPPKTVAPAAAPRWATKSRIRVREDVDPRRQPTVKTARASETERTPTPAPGSDAEPPPSARDRTSGERRAAPRERAPVTEGPASERRAGEDAPPESRTRRSQTRLRRGRTAWALLVSVIVAGIVYFWLRLPAELGSRPGGGAPPSTSAPAPAAPKERAAPRATARPPATGSPAPGTGGVKVRGAERDRAPGAAAGPAAAPRGRAPAKGPAAPRGAPSGAPSATQDVEASTAARPSPEDSGFLIRKKGDRTQ